MNAPLFSITREKHLDHLVKVVPLIVLGYGIQSYILMNMRGPLSGTTLLVLGCMLVLMIGGFVVYDVYQKVTLSETHLTVDFLFFHKSIAFDQIVDVQTTDPKESFGTVLIRTKHARFRLFFVDDVEVVKRWIDERNQSLPLAA